MGEKKNNGVTAIVPAYNEASRIGSVLQILTTSPSLQEIIVVDDGSTDETEKVVKSYPSVRYVRQDRNQGKGAAMDRGVQEATYSTIFFCDADIQGLRHEVVSQIVEPVKSGEVEMFVGMRNRKSYALRVILAFVPLLGGERALTTALWAMLPNYFKTRFRIEAALNFYAKYYGKGLRFKVFHGVRQTIKEKKYGFWKGLKARLGMFRDYLQAQVKLQFVHIPRIVVDRRLALLSFFSNLLGISLGILFLLAAYYGPREFLLTLFGEKLVQNPDAHLVRFILYWAGVVSTDVILIIAFIVLTLNVLICLGNSKKVFIIFRGYYKKWKLLPLSPQKFTSPEIVGEKHL